MRLSCAPVLRNNVGLGHNHRSSRAEPMSRSWWWRRLSAAPWDRLPTVNPASQGLGLDQPAADRIACEVDAVAHPELAEDVGAVAFDRFDAKNEDCRDLL
jgi:hypothetical protein